MSDRRVEERTIVTIAGHTMTAWIEPKDDKKLRRCHFACSTPSGACDWHVTHLLNPHTTRWWRLSGYYRHQWYNHVFGSDDLFDRFTPAYRPSNMTVATVTNPRTGNVWTYRLSKERHFWRATVKGPKSTKISYTLSHLLGYAKALEAAYKQAMEVWADRVEIHWFPLDPTAVVADIVAGLQGADNEQVLEKVHWLQQLKRSAESGLSLVEAMFDVEVNGDGT